MTEHEIQISRIGMLGHSLAHLSQIITLATTISETVQKLVAEQQDATSDRNQSNSPWADNPLDSLSMPIAELEKHSNQLMKLISETSETLRHALETETSDIPENVKIVAVEINEDQQGEWNGYQISLSYQPERAYLMLKPDEGDSWVPDDLAGLLNWKSIRTLNNGFQASVNCNDFSMVEDMMKWEFRTIKADINHKLAVHLRAFEELKTQFSYALADGLQLAA